MSIIEQDVEHYRLSSKNHSFLAEMHQNMSKIHQKAVQAKKNRDYQRKYHKKRYHSDPAFRAYCIMAAARAARKSRREHPDLINSRQREARRKFKREHPVLYKRKAIAYGWRRKK